MDWFKKLDLPKVRNGVQIAFGLFLLYVAWQFYRFVEYFETGGITTYVNKPGAVEGFLPISSLMGFKLWIVEGVFDPFHPAGLVIFIAILLVSLLFKKGFCSWICPIGTISEGLGRLGQKLFGRNFTLPVYLDYFLQGLKYLVLLFFVKVIFIDMPTLSIYFFLRGEYNLISDVKMMKFFLSPSTTTIVVISVLVVLSVLIKHFWCRYLCPYGALLGILSFLSPWKIFRDKDLCIDCKLCDKACANQIEISKASTVYSPECSGCLDCLSACPKKGALELKVLGKYAPLKPYLFPVLLFALWFLIIGIGKLTGHWESPIPYEVYKELIPLADIFDH